MKKRIFLVLFLLVISMLAGCNGTQSMQKSPSEGDIRTAEDTMDTVLKDITPTEKITELEKGFSAVRCEGNYGFDGFLSGGTTGNAEPDGKDTEGEKADVCPVLCEVCKGNHAGFPYREKAFDSAGM